MSATATGPLLLAVEIETYLPASTVEMAADAWGVTEWGAAGPDAGTIEDTSILLASDRGYVTREDDDGGLRIFPAILSSGIEIDREIELAPDGSSGSYGWGSIRLVSDAGALRGVAAFRNADGRPITVRMGRAEPAAYGWRDPPLADMAVLTAGVGAGWVMGDRELRITLRDPGYWAEGPIEGESYSGTGGLGGTPALAGKRWPRVRGGTSLAPVREVAPTLVDETLGIYQVSDTRGSIVTLYERGLAGGVAPVFGSAVSDITVAAPSAGTYDVESSARGLFLRLGSFPPEGVITVDCTGAFPDNTTPTTPAELALQVLLQDMAIPSGYLDTASFAALATASPWVSGFAIPAGEPTNGATLLALLMRSACARLVPTRAGLLAATKLTALPAGTVPVASYSDAEIVTCVQRALPAPLAPPPYRMRVGHSRYHTTQTTGLAPTLTGARVQDLAEQWRIGSAASAPVQAAWRRPSDPALIETALLDATGGNALAESFRDLWCVPEGRRRYDVALPIRFATAQEIGDPIALRFPGVLAAGALGRVVGEQLRTADNLVTLRVLV